MNSIFKQLTLHKRCIICSFTPFLVSIYAAKFYFDFIKKKTSVSTTTVLQSFYHKLAVIAKQKNMQEETLRYALNDRMIGLSEF